MDDGTPEYHGCHHGALLIRRGRRWFQQSDDGALGPKFHEFAITKKEAAWIMALERRESDMVFGYDNTNIPPPTITPFWHTSPREYLAWHRANDPPQWSDRAAAALAALDAE